MDSSAALIRENPRFPEVRAGEAFPAGNRMEHRWGPRRPCKLRVMVSGGGGISAVARLRNVSLTGAFLETPVPLPLFAQIELTVLHNQGSNHVVEFPAQVVRRARDGVGIEWCDPNLGPICRKLGCERECALARGLPG